MHPSDTSSPPPPSDSATANAPQKSEPGPENSDQSFDRSLHRSLEANADIYPMLRPLDVYPVDAPLGEGRNQKLLALADPSGIAPAVVTLPPFGAAVIELCDGSRTRDEICSEFLARYRRALPKESLDALLKKLDEALMLDSMRFRLHCARLFAEFAEMETRPAFAAGLRYPSDAAALRRLLIDAFTPPNGPGLNAGDAARDRQAGSALPRLIVAPTVDFTRGGPAYAWAFWPLLFAPRLPDLIVLIGCDHGAHDPIVTLTRKHFATPLGSLLTDVELVETLIADATELGAQDGVQNDADARSLGDLLTRDESHHRGEHSLEFLAVWLCFIVEYRRLLKIDAEDAPIPRILPILCGSLHELAQSPPSRDDKLEPQKTTRFLDEFARLLQNRVGERQKNGQQVLWLGAGDLAHVGPRFGDAEALLEEDRDSLERRDRETLRPALSGDAQGFLSEIRRERDRRRVAGLGTLYLLLATACPGAGRLRCYAQCAVDEGSYISTASLVYP